MSPARALLAELQAAGISVVAQPDGGLACRPVSALTDELRAAIRQHKPALLALLSGKPPRCRPCGRPQHHPDIICGPELCPSWTDPDPAWPIAPPYVPLAPAVAVDIPREAA